MCQPLAYYIVRYAASCVMHYLPATGTSMVYIIVEGESQQQQVELVIIDHAYMKGHYPPAYML